ncbi:insulin-degrading enzyme-like 1, peroxisomal isoform X2 [Cynara cardunculus var. scolymus]|uniref:insulin-degrading enzyme-like 1, peroxisomal isoform X2 n=1 Tax=Cynara cardunculus var. scolymus TaxID=59895 RepID=UPI000D62E440|nr:insulin-degrading enzyme-like 1, peroxisomal isoform X2 [Cynara cardunculus var. scolymus]
MAIGKEKLEVVEIIKPRTDNRDYRRVILPNSLQVLLISDPDTDKCSASMNVGVGSFSDPEGLEGLAHFLEHMLFYASEKYPLEDSYSTYISEHGGRTNAYTSSEHTNYYFDVNADCFEEALDRFAQFFIKPLMSSDATTREIKAVDSENQKNLLSDAWRINQLQKHLSAEGHPYHKFSTGNWDTLEVRPKARGVDTRDELLIFYKENYSANLMNLVVYAKESLDKIESRVLSKFKEIRNIDRIHPSFPGQPCTSEHLQIIVKTVPIKRGHKLRITWPITPGIHHYMEGPSRYLGHLIGHEGEGSLFYILKKLGWATSLSAGESDWTVEFSFFKVVIDLSDAGHANVEHIIGLLFKYISLLQQSGVCKWIFDELSAICEMVFHYQDKIPPIDYVVKIASNMQLYPPKDWLVGSSLPSIFSPGVIQSFLNELTPNNVRIFWESTNFEGHTDLTEPWYGTAYSVEKITDSIIQEWMERAPDEHLHLPTANVFIPTDLSIKNVRKKVNLPVLLRKSAYSKLWYKPDTTFSTPKAYVKLDFYCPFGGNSPEANVLTDVSTRLLMDYLNEYAYDAQVAGLYYAISHTDNGFQVTLTGYSQKLKILLETVIEKITTFEVKPDRFYVIKELLVKQYENFKFQQPYQQAMYYCSLLLRDQSWPWSDELEVLAVLEPDVLSRFYPQILSRTFIECYAAGNIESNEAELMIQHVENAFFKGVKPLSQALFPSQHLANRIVKLERGTNYCYTKGGLNPSDENSALLHYVQVHQDDFKLNIKLQLVALIAKQPAFHQLRSVEQLGYITVLMQRNDSGIRGVQFIIQSTVKGPKHIESRVQAFLKMFESKLYEMPDDEFKSNVNALIEMKLEKHKNLREESGYFWREIQDGTLKFDRKEYEVAALKQLTKAELIQFFDEHIKVGAPQKKTLSVQVYATTHSTEDMADNGDCNMVNIEDVFGFRRSRPLYGSFKGGIGHMKL